MATATSSRKGNGHLPSPKLDMGYGKVEVLGLGLKQGMT